MLSADSISLGNPGRKRIDDRKALCRILFVLYTATRRSSCPKS